MALTKAFGPTLAHLDCQPSNVQTSVDLTASAKADEQSQKLQHLLLDPSLVRIYHLDFGVAGQMRALHIATCRAREVAARRFSQKPNQHTPLAPLVITISDDLSGARFAPGGLSSKLAFELAVSLVREHLQLEEQPTVHFADRAAHFRVLDLWMVLGASKPSCQCDLSSASATLSTLLGDLSSITESPHKRQLLWHDYSHVNLAPYVLKGQAKQPRCAALISTKNPLKATSSWRQMCVALEMDDVPLVNAHESFCRLQGRSLVDMPSWSHVLELDSRDSQLLSLHRVWMKQALSTCLIRLFPALGDGPRAFATSLRAELCDLCLTYGIEDPKALWPGIRPPDEPRQDPEVPPPGALLEDAKYIADVCWCPLSGHMGPMSTAFLDEYSASPNSDTLLIPAVISDGGEKSTKHWLLARVSVRLLSSHFSEICRWQTCRPKILTGADRENAKTRQSALVNEEMAVIWKAFSETMRKLLDGMLEAILSLSDIEEQARWLGIAAQLEQANSHLTHGPMTLKADEILKHRSKDE